jgi:hypothetical protein
MKNKIFFCLGLSLIMSGSLLSQKWVSLFNGKDLTGWTNNGHEKWYVENHELICESGPEKQYGYLSTNKSYRNFTLSLQFKQEANGNRGDNHTQWSSDRGSA